MDVFKDLEEVSTNLKKLRDSIYENDIFETATDKQQETLYKMLKSLIVKTEAYMKEFDNKSHVVQTYADLERLKNSIHSEDITFYVNTFSEKLDWYWENERKEVDGNFIAAADVVILWPLRLINERMYRYLFNQTLDSRFDRVFAEIDENN